MRTRLRFRTRCRLFAFLDHDGRWVTACRTHGHLGTGSEAYADYLAAIHAGNHPA